MEFVKNIFMTADGYFLLAFAGGIIYIAWKVIDPFIIKNRPIPNKVNWEPSDQILPMQLEQQGHQAGLLTWTVISILGLLSLAAGILMLVFFVYFLFKGNKEYLVYSLVALLPLSIAAVCYLFARNQSVLRKNVLIQRDSVHYSFKDLRRDIHWQEPLANYQGVRLTRFKVEIGKNSYTTWSIDLVHPVPSKSIRLFSPTFRFNDMCTHPDVPKKIQEYAQLLSVPVLESVYFSHDEVEKADTAL